MYNIGGMHFWNFLHDILNCSALQNRGSMFSSGSVLEHNQFQVHPYGNNSSPEDALPGSWLSGKVRAHS